MENQLLNNGKDVTEIVYQKNIKKETRLIGSQRKKTGLTLWKFNKKTGTIEKAEFRKVEHKLNFNKTDLEKRYEVVIDPDCTYIQALNKKNAQRKLDKYLK